MAQSELSRGRGTWIAVAMTAVSTLSVCVAAYVAAQRAQPVPSSFVLWALTPTFTSLAILWAHRRFQPATRSTPLFVIGVNAVVALLYFAGAWVEKDPSFLFIFIPLYENGALVVSASFSFVIAALARFDT